MTPTRSGVLAACLVLFAVLLCVLAGVLDLPRLARVGLIAAALPLLVGAGLLVGSAISPKERTAMRSDGPQRRSRLRSEQD